MRLSKKGVWDDTLVKAILFVAIILVIFFVVILPIARSGVTWEDVKKNIASGKILTMFTKNTDDVFGPGGSGSSGSKYLCDGTTFYESLSGSKIYFIKARCLTNGAVFSLFDDKKKSLNEQITVEESASRCFPVSKVCVNLNSVTTEDKKTYVDFEVTDTSAIFEAFALSLTHPTNEFMCGRQTLSIKLEKYTPSPKEACFSLKLLKDGKIIDLVGTPSSPGICSNVYNCRFDSNGNAYPGVSCPDGGEVSCGSITLKCSNFDNSKKEFYIYGCENSAES